MRRSSTDARDSADERSAERITSASKLVRSLAAEGSSGANLASARARYASSRLPTTAPQEAGSRICTLRSRNRSATTCATSSASSGFARSRRAASWAAFQARRTPVSISSPSRDRGQASPPGLSGLASRRFKLPAMMYPILRSSQGLTPHVSVGKLRSRQLHAT